MANSCRFRASLGVCGGRGRGIRDSQSSASRLVSGAVRDGARGGEGGWRALSDGCEACSPPVKDAAERIQGALVSVGEGVNILLCGPLFVAQAFHRGR